MMAIHSNGADLTSPSIVVISLVSLVPLQVSVIKLQRLDNKIRFLPSGNSLWNELGYPLVTESRFFLLIGLFPP